MINTKPLPATIEWLNSLPCVINEEVIIDTRACYPTAIIGLIAKPIETQEEFFTFIGMYLNLPLDVWKEHYRQKVLKAVRDYYDS